MGKVSVDDKLRIQTLREQELGYRSITAKYPEKNWKLDRAPAHTAKLAQNWIATNCSDFIGKDGTHQTLILLISMSGELCLNVTRHFKPSLIPSTS